MTAAAEAVETLSRTLDIAEQILADGRDEDALEIVRRVLDVLDPPRR